MRKVRKSLVGLVVALWGSVFILTWQGLPLPALGNDWLGLEIGKSTLEDAKKCLGETIQEQPDYWVFRGGGIRDGLNPDTIQVNIDPVTQAIQSIFIFPIWGVTTDIDIHKYFGKGRVATYGTFLSSTGANYGAGTRCGQKLHYMQLENKSEIYEEMGVVVIYDSRDLASEQDVVKLVMFCNQKRTRISSFSPGMKFD